jgi:hypothetical protein
LIIKKIKAHIISLPGAGYADQYPNGVKTLSPFYPALLGKFDFPRCYPAAHCKTLHKPINYCEIIGVVL